MTSCVRGTEPAILVDADAPGILEAAFEFSRHARLWGFDVSDLASIAVAGSATTTGLHDPWDVIVIGGGNAALVAAMTARRLVKRVLLLERAPEFMRGGNTRHTSDSSITETQLIG
jgi:NADPH-dependent 2,4-dienoyl-CoA reductase/sulfur reductase-like enzyme